MKQSFTTESVCRGHPDKVADQISEYIADFLISKDPDARCGIEVMVLGNMIIIGGEINSKIPMPHDECNWKHIIRLIRDDIGYCEKTWPGLETLAIKFRLNQQSSELATLSKKGAGDNCTVYGMATNNEEAEYMPIGHQFASIYMRTLAEDEHRGWYGPDGKVQVVQGVEGIKKITAFFQEPGKEGSAIVTDALSHACNQTGIPEDQEPEWECQKFEQGGPVVDTGMTGRKLMVDTYGTYSAHGGGAFAGKDVSKPDKTLALFARYLCKNIVRLGYCETISLQLSIRIGQEGDFDYDYQALGDNIKFSHISKTLEYFGKYTMVQIIKLLRLKEVKFSKFAFGGYFGRTEKDAYWERMRFPKDFFDKALLDVSPSELDS